MSEEYSADFTTSDHSAAVRCGRGDHCAVQYYPPGTQLNYLHSNTPGEPGRAVCDSCFQYYIVKKTTKRRTTSREVTAVDAAASSTSRHIEVSSGPTISNVEEQIIKRQIVQAQQGAAGCIIQQVGTHINRQPLIQIPGIAPAPIPPANTKHTYASPLALAPGYTTNHLNYQAMRAQAASIAYAGQAAQVVIVEVRVAHMPAGKTKSQLIGDLLQVVDNISVHIGAVELKSKLFQEILPAWSQYTRNYPITIDDFIMRNKNWVEIRPKNPDRDAIMDASFFKRNKGGQLIFKGGKAIIQFHVPNTFYNAYETWLEDQEYDNLSQAATPCPVLNCPPSSGTSRKANMKGRKRALTRSTNEITESATSLRSTHRNVNPTPVSPFGSPTSPSVSPRPKRPRIGHKSFHLNEPLSPVKGSALDGALRAQKQPSAHDVRFLFENTKSIHVLVYLVNRVNSFNELSTILDWKMHFDFRNPLDVRLHLNMSPDTRKKGGFKIAYLGTSSQPLFGGDSAICAKQSFYTKTKDIVLRQGKAPTKVQQDIAYDGIKQAQDLIIEVTCLNWAHALLEMVYKFIDKRIGKQKADSTTSYTIDIPRMRFVNAGLAIEQIDANLESRCFLVEEEIPQSDGSFRKYLGNTSAVPRKFVNSADNERAEFLSFAQHVQYLQTNKRAYVADFQGGTTLLTDPQILTNGNLGVIFAEGNLPSTFGNFESDHLCNKYCIHFDLPTDFSNWGLESEDYCSDSNNLD